jgi:hypothetical protein
MTYFPVGFHPMLRRIIRSAAVLLAGGVLLLHPVFASAEEQKPPEMAQGEQKPEDKAEDKAAEAKAAEQKAMEEYEEALEALPKSAGAPECVWTGRRIASLLWRDDIDTARRYMELYDRFSCSPEHLKLVFRCVIRQGPIDPKAADKLASRVHGCWVAPDEPTTAASRATTGSATKGGTIPN